VTDPVLIPIAPKAKAPTPDGEIRRDESPEDETVFSGIAGLDRN